MFFVGLVGCNGESLSQFLVSFLKFLFRRRRLRYYIDAGEPEPPKEKGLAWLKSLFNQRKYKNPHMAIMGTTDSGKTVIEQCMATRMRRKHVATYIIAPLKGHEYARAAKAIGGQFIRISTGSPHCINVMEIRPMDNSANVLLDGDMEEQNYLSMKIDKPAHFLFHHHAGDDQHRGAASG